MAAKGRTIEAEDVERVAHLIQPAFDLRGFGGVMVTGALDAGLDFAEGHAGEMEFGIVNALKPGEHSAVGARPAEFRHHVGIEQEAMGYSSMAGRRRALPRGGTRVSVRALGDSSSSLRLGLAAACSRRHCSIGTNTAASVPRRETTCGPSLWQASRSSLKRALAC